MTLYTPFLFVHVLAVLVLTAALAVEAWMLWQMRSAASLNEIRLWTVPPPRLTWAAIISLVALYATGAFLTERLGAWALAWPRFAVLEVVLFAFFGALTGRRLRTIRRLCASGSEAMNQVLSPFLKISLSIRIWIVIGTVLLMAAKPGLKESLGIVISSLVLGSASALLPFRERATEQRHTI